ncbi:bifunctional nuclease domain-containing protein [Verrucomicrobiota bacterium]
MIPVKVDQLFFSNMGFVVLLRKSGEERALPIFIGAAEAQAIALYLNNVDVPRPLTHDLMKQILDSQECRLKRIEVCDLKDSTFYARLIIERDEIEMEMDSRPSDAIALALRFKAPIYIDKKIMDEAGRVFTDSDIMGSENIKKKSQKTEKMTPLQTLEHELEESIKAERYENAAKLRDEIKRLGKNNTKN